MGKEKGNLKKICDQGITIELGFNIKKKGIKEDQKNISTKESYNNGEAWRA